MEEQGHKNPPPSLPPLQIYFLKFLIFSCLFDWTKFSFVCFLKILLKIMFHLLSFRYFVKCIQNGFLYSTICLLQGFCDMFMSIFVFVFLLVVCSYIYIIYIYIYIYIHIMFAMHCGVYDVIMTRECSLNEVTFCNFDFFLMF